MELNSFQQSLAEYGGGGGGGGAAFVGGVSTINGDGSTQTAYEFPIDIQIGEVYQLTFFGYINNFGGASPVFCTNEIGTQSFTLTGFAPFCNNGTGRNFFSTIYFARTETELQIFPQTYIGPGSYGIQNYTQITQYSPDYKILIQSPTGSTTTFYGCVLQKFS